MGEGHPYPGGDGKPDCPTCGGRGAISIEGAIPPAVRRCRCVLVRDVLANVEHGWKGLSKAKVIEDSDLKGLTERNLLITGSDRVFRRHLRHVAVRMGPEWDFKVVSDADLITSWLASVALKGGELLDPDAATVSTRYITLVDLIEPPQLLVIRLGVKKARNVAMSEVLLEALTHRHHNGKVTWITDQPDDPLGEMHRCWSTELTLYMQDWDHVVLQQGFENLAVKSTIRSPAKKKPAPRSQSTKSNLGSLMDNEGRPDKKTKKKGRKR